MSLSGDKGVAQFKKSVKWDTLVPNVFWFWKDDEETLEIRVLKKIEEGLTSISTVGTPFH